jgi:hypothetical protein
MPTREEIDNQLKLLARYRSNLQHLVQQAAGHGGEGAAPLPVVNGISAQREQIDALKVWLRAAGVAVADEFNDGPGALAELSAAPAPAGPSEAPPAPLRPSSRQQLELARLLLASQAIADRGSREIVLGFLPVAVRNSIARSAADLPDVIGIVQACARYDGALEQLVQAVHDFEGDSVAVKQILQWAADLK